jgi:hypothetical protein
MSETPHNEVRRVLGNSVNRQLLSVEEPSNVQYSVRAHRIPEAGTLLLIASNDTP